MNDNEHSMKAELAVLVEAVRRADYDVAIGGLKQFLATYPQHEVALGLLASVYFQIGMREQARSLYEQLLGQHPENALARFQLGLLRSADDPREALSLWAPLLTSEGEFMAHFHSALAHVQLGEPEAARPLLEEAAEHMPSSHPLREQLERLRGSLQKGTGGRTGYSS